MTGPGLSIHLRMKAAHISALSGGSESLGALLRLLPLMGRKAMSRPGAPIHKGSLRANGSLAAWTGIGTGVWGTVLFPNHSTLCNSTSVVVK